MKYVQVKLPLSFMSKVLISLFILVVFVVVLLIGVQNRSLSNQQIAGNIPTPTFKVEGYVVDIYFKTNVPEIQILKIKDDIQRLYTPISIEYTSQNDAYEVFKNANKDNMALLEISNPNLIPPSIEVFVKNETDTEKIKNYAQSLSEIDEVTMYKKYSQKGEERIRDAYGL
ncbi:MAG: permease-like cell division protein FtsX [bacterium]|nr:permease-like cell division protein FtsX [bacterium]